MSPRREADAFLAAVIFLTRIPVRRVLPFGPELLARSTVFFPAVGAVIGGAGAAAYGLAHVAFSSPVLAAMAAVTATIVLTGAFHEDGLADTFDGLGGGWTRQSALAIMKDSRIGTYGVLAVTLVLAGRIAVVAMLAPAAAVAALIVGHTLARWSSLALANRLPYARPDGAGKPVAEGVTARRLAAGTLIAGLIVLPLGVTLSLLAFAASGLVAWCTGLWYAKRIGGVTGDTLGATNQCTELAIYFVALALS